MRRRGSRSILLDWLPQVAVLGLLLSLALWLVGNTVANLANRGITVGFGFLDRAARFPISESILDYSPVDSFGWAFVVGLGNTLFLSAIVILASTLLGFVIAIARRSANPMASMLGATYVDITRNTPLVVQLLFWYAAVTFGLPHSAEAVNPVPGIYLTDRGLYLPRPICQGSTTGLAVGLVLAAGVMWACRRRGLGRIPTAGLGLLVAILAWIMAGMSMRLELPALGRFNFMGGIILTPELVAVALGLIVYSSAFTAEIIRGGIEAVPLGQWEAASALGLAPRDTMRRIILPQALRIIIPPMASQYINIVKNSTLGLVVGYPELNFVTATTINQSGQAIEGIIVLMVIFLGISIGTSLLLGYYNKRVALVER
nr:ABC transporter permease subunit [Sphingomonas sp. Y57]